ncbi:MAG: glycoside hydrolase 43 family protein [Ferruginibacter sp.]
MKLILFTLLFISYSIGIDAQYISKVWVADNGDGTYKNPVINADYSDPDVIRVDNDFYLISSSFNQTPGLPVLHSNDLVNWTIICHVLQQQFPLEHFNKVQNGNGVWAPSIRYHNHEFYIYYPDPDFGIYMTKAKNINGPWTDPVMVQAGRGLIDPCPLWDDNGKVYLVHAFAGSRAGIKSILVVKQLNAEGTKVIDEGVLVFDGHDTDPTLEGPKFYKRNGWYYIFAPAGGVGTGWQIVLRSKNIYGPYERKVVMDQGSGKINGPHQGAWVTTASGEDWFLHFQDKDAYGRVVHLQPMQWKNDWPVIGVDKDADGKGEPVMIFKKPFTSKKYPVETPAESDEFNTAALGMQWQWRANPKPSWAMPFITNGVMRLYAQSFPDSVKNYYEVPNILTQKFPAEEFTATTKFIFKPKQEGDKVALTVMGMSYAYIAVIKKADGIYISNAVCNNADKKNNESEKIISKISAENIWLRVKVLKGAVCNFSYSINGTDFINAGEIFTATPGRWIGATIGLFCSETKTTNDSGFADFDWFRVN